MESDFRHIFLEAWSFAISWNGLVSYPRVSKGYIFSITGYLISIKISFLNIKGQSIPK